VRAMILAAGRGERMRPLTDRLPKPLLVAGGKPLIVHHLEALKAAGFTRVLINHAHLGHKIESTLGAGSAWGLELEFSQEDKALETGGGICNALPLLGAEPFWVINGDVWTDYPFTDLRLANGILAHLVLVENPPHHSGGDFALSEGLVRADGARRLTFSGLGVYHPGLFAGCEPGTAFRLAPLLRAAMEQSRVSGERYGGRWMDIGTPERLKELDRILRSGPEQIL